MPVHRLYLPALFLAWPPGGEPLVRMGYPPPLGDGPGPAYYYTPVVPRMDRDQGTTDEDWSANELLLSNVWLAGQLSSLLLLAVAIAATAPAVADQRSRGTMEVALLTTAPREDLLAGWAADGWRLWLRVAAYLAPVYLMGCAWPALWLPGSWVQVLGIAGSSGDLREFAFTVLDEHRAVQVLVGLAMLALRIFHDVSVAALAAAVALRVAARSASRGSALTAGFAAGLPVALASAVLPRAVVSAAAWAAAGIGFGLDSATQAFAFTFSAAGFVLLRQLLARRLFDSTAGRLESGGPRAGLR